MTKKPAKSTKLHPESRSRESGMRRKSPNKIHAEMHPALQSPAFIKHQQRNVLQETTTLKLPPARFRKEEPLPGRLERKSPTEEALVLSRRLREAAIRAGGFPRDRALLGGGAPSAEMLALADGGDGQIDDRTVMMGSTIRSPWSSVVVILAEHPDPAEGTLLGSGFFIHQQILITAGHVVFPHPGPARSLRIHRPFPQAEMNGESGIDLYPMSAGVWVHPEWLASENARELDIGAVFFPSSFSRGPGIMPFNMNPADGFPVRVGGFPRDFPPGTPAEFAQPGTLVTGGGLIEHISTHRIIYNAFTSVGESGGPAVCSFTDPNDGQSFEAAVGVHNYGLTPGRNAASRFTQDLINRLNEVLKDLP